MERRRETAAALRTTLTTLAEAEEAEFLARRAAAAAEEAAEAAEFEGSVDALVAKAAKVQEQAEERQRSRAAALAALEERARAAGPGTAIGADTHPDAVEVGKVGGGEHLSDEEVAALLVAYEKRHRGISARVQPSLPSMESLPIVRRSANLA